MVCNECGRVRRALMLTLLGRRICWKCYRKGVR